MTTKRNLLLALLLLFAIAAGTVLYTRDDLTFPGGALGDTPAPSGTRETAEAEPTFAWEAREAGEGADGAPRSTLALIYNGERYELGTYTGSCAEIKPENWAEGEVAGVLCWWAGGGEEVGVFREEGGYVVRKGVQEESTAESEGFRGNFTTLLELE